MSFPGTDGDKKAIDDGWSKFLMINLYHPCYEIDVVACVDYDEERYLTNQGYVSVALLRELLEKHKNQLKEKANE